MRAARSVITGRKPPRTPTDRLLLTPSDFTYEGKYYISGNGHNNNDYFSKALTHRWVSGQLRIMWLSRRATGDPYANSIKEGAIPANFEGNIETVADHHPAWQDPTPPNTEYGFAGDGHAGMYFDAVENRCWTYISDDYPSDIGAASMVSMEGRTLGNSSGPGTNFTGRHGLNGVGSRATAGRHQRTPAWAVSQWGFRPWISFGGGYTSRLNQGESRSALGPIIAMYDDPMGFTPVPWNDPVGSIPAENRTILVDYRGDGNSAEDWYDDYTFANRPFDRAPKITNVQNEFEFPFSVLRRQWLSKPDMQPPGDPEGWNRWTWGDTYAGTGNWIDNEEGTRLRHGIVYVQAVSKGRAWYEFAILNQTGSAYEIVIYDPQDLRRAQLGQVPVWQVRPKHMFVIPDNHIINSGVLDGATNWSTGATFVPEINKFFVAIYNTNGVSVLLQYAV